MSQSDRRANRSRRGSTRNESCGLGGNEAAEKPRLKAKEETVPVRKPNLTPHTPKPKESRFEENPSKIRVPKPHSMSLDDPVKTLTEFNRVVNALVNAGVGVVERAGGFVAVARVQKSLLDDAHGEFEALPPELSSAFEVLAASIPKYLKKEVGADGKVRYLYSTMDKKKTRS